MKKINIRLLVYIFLIIPFFNIAYLNYVFPTLYKINIYWTILNGIMIFLVAIKKNIKWSSIINYIILFLLLGLIITFINDGDFSKMLVISYKIIVLSVFIDLKLKTDKENFISAFNIYFVILIIINLLSILLFPDGMYVGDTGYHENWFLGYRNSFIIYILPSLFFNFIYAYYKNNKLGILNYLYFTIIIVSVLITKSSTSIIFLIIIFLYLFLKKIGLKLNFINIRNELTLYFSLFFSIVVFRLQNIFKWLIVDILHKDITLTNRVFIWDYVWNFISENNYRGYGMEYSYVRYNKTKIIKSYHAHNELLEITYQFGILGVFLFLLILFKSCKKLWIYKDFELTKLLSVLLFSMLIVFLSESYSYEYFMYLFVVVFNIDKLVDTSIKREV